MLADINVTSLSSAFASRCLAGPQRRWWRWKLRREGRAARHWRWERGSGGGSLTRPQVGRLRAFSVNRNPPRLTVPRTRLNTRGSKPVQGKTEEDRNTTSSKENSFSGPLTLSRRRGKGGLGVNSIHSRWTWRNYYSDATGEIPGFARKHVPVFKQQEVRWPTFAKVTLSQRR